MKSQEFAITRLGESMLDSPLLRTDFIPDNATVGGIIRNGDAIIAKGDVQIEAGDNVVIFALPTAVKKVIKLFQK